MIESTMNLQPALLEDDLVKIVPLKENDFDILFVVASDPLIWEQHPTKDRYKKEVFQVYFDSAVSSGSAFLLLEKATSELMGSTRYYDYHPEQSRIAIGYTFLARKFWGGEYNRAVKKLLLDYAFEFVDSVIFHIGPTNIRSQKAILKIGAKKIGEVLYDGKQHFEYEIRKADWRI
jgi:RimJ/RimL family protein N-acetyltransferase